MQVNLEGTDYRLRLLASNIYGTARRDLGLSQSERANGSAFHRAFREKVTPRGISKTPSKPPKLLSLIGPVQHAKASNYPAFLRALGRSFPDAALDALSALPPRADIRSAKWNVCFGRWVQPIEATPSNLVR
jgi:hypothetical protein